TQAAILGGSTGNVFNLALQDGGGNYWNDWTSPDSDGDGFVDSPYLIYEYGTSTNPLAQDNLPWAVQDGWSAPSNQPPVADAGPDQTVLVNEVVEFDGSASYDEDGTITSYLWDFGGGTPTGSGMVVTHAYSAAGTYTVTLTVTDDDGATGTDAATITVLTLLTFFDEAVADGTLVGTSSYPAIAQLQLDFMRDLLEIADLFIAEGWTGIARILLEVAYNFTDGQPQPPDLVAGDAAPALAAGIQAKIDSL
ncbi:MAG: PKD domain-containing protein, partial [Phycisphaerales bacterium]